MASAATWLLARLITQGQPMGTNTPRDDPAGEQAGTATLADGER